MWPHPAIVLRWILWDKVSVGRRDSEERQSMLVSLTHHIQPLVALVAGILILLMPRLLNFIVAIYLIIIGITGLWPHLLR